MSDQYGFDRTRIDGVSRVTVIMVERTVGDGTTDDPVRRVIDFYADSGDLIVSCDTIHEVREGLA